MTKIREYIRRFIEDALVHSQRNRSPDDGIDLDQEPTNAGSTDTIAGDFGMGGRFGSMNNIWEWWMSPDTMEGNEPDWMHDDTHSPGDIWKTASGIYGAVNQAGELDYFDNSRAAQDYINGPQGSTNIFPNVQPGSIPLQRNLGVTKSPTGVPLTSPDVRDFPTMKDIERDQDELDKLGADGPMNQTNQSNTSPYFGMPDFNGMDPRFYDFEKPVNLDKEQAEKPEYLPMSNPPHEFDDYPREDPHLQTGTGHEFPDEKYWIYPKDYPKEQEEPEADFSPPTSDEMDLMYRTWLKHHPEDVDEAGSKLNPNLARTPSGLWMARHPRSGTIRVFGAEEKPTADLFSRGQDEPDDRPIDVPVHSESLSYQLSDYLQEMLNERNYRKEYDNYQGTPEQKKRRAMRNKVRREALRKGIAQKGDGKDIHHKDHNAFNDNTKNLSKMDQGPNRSDNLHHPGEKMEVSDDTSNPPGDPRSTWSRPRTAPHYHTPTEKNRQPRIEGDESEDRDKKITKILLLALLKTIIAERQRAQQMGLEATDPNENEPKDRDPWGDDTGGGSWGEKEPEDPFNDRERFGGTGFEDVPLPKKHPKDEVEEPETPKLSPEDQAEEDERRQHEEDKARIRDILFRASGDPTWHHN